jgi:hypothetical protein
MANVALCRLSMKRLELLRADPPLAQTLRKEIQAGAVPFAVWVGRFGNEKDRSAPDLVGGMWSALTRRERLEARFSELGPRAWDRVREVIDGEVGEPLRSYARILNPLLVARVAAAMRRTPKPAAASSIESIADRVCALFRDTCAAGERVLVLGPARRAKVHAPS